MGEEMHYCRFRRSGAVALVVASSALTLFGLAGCKRGDKPAEDATTTVAQSAPKETAVLVVASEPKRDAIADVIEVILEDLVVSGLGDQTMELSVEFRHRFVLAGNRLLVLF